MRLDVAILSRPGGRERNEDACGHWNSGRHFAGVVADGAGGHGGGDVASRLAVREALGRFSHESSLDPAHLRDVLLEASRAIVAQRGAVPGGSDMHTTAVMLALDLLGGTASWVNAGDSRLYGFRGGARFVQSRDHSVVQSMVEAGLLAEGEVRAHPLRNELYSALGRDESELEIGTAGEPIRVAPGDAFLLCTDGLWEFVQDETLAATLARSRSPQDWLAALESAVLDGAADKPNHDNFTALAVWVGADDPGD